MAETLRAMAIPINKRWHQMIDGIWPGAPDINFYEEDFDISLPFTEISTHLASIPEEKQGRYYTAINEVRALIQKYRASPQYKLANGIPSIDIGYDAIFYVNTHGFVKSGSTCVGPSCLVDGMEILTPPHGMHATFLSATPIGVKNYVGINSFRYEQVKQTQRFIDGMIEKGHFSIESLQRFLRSTKDTHGTAKHDRMYQSKQGYEITHRYIERFYMPDKRFGYAVKLLYVSDAVKEKLKELRGADDPINIDVTEDLFYPALRYTTTHGFRNPKDPHRRKTLYLTKTELLQFAHLFCNNPLVIDTSCSVSAITNQRFLRQIQLNALPFREGVSGGKTRKRSRGNRK